MAATTQQPFRDDVPIVVQRNLREFGLLRVRVFQRLLLGVAKGSRGILLTFASRFLQERNDAWLGGGHVAGFAMCQLGRRTGALRDSAVAHKHHAEVPGNKLEKRRGLPLYSLIEQVLARNKRLVKDESAMRVKRGLVTFTLHTARFVNL